MRTAAIGIVAHFDRIEMAERLANRLQPTVIAYDDGTFGATANHRRVWTDLAFSTNRHSPWCLVVEDDAQPIPGAGWSGFHAQLDAALSVAPAPIVSLYLGTGRPLAGWQGRIRQATTEANSAGAHWIVSNHVLHAVAIAIRTDLVPDMLAFTATTNLVADDALTAWATVRSHRVAYSWPSLVDHNDDVVSLAEHRDGKPRTQRRRAWATGGHRNWNERAVDMLGHPFRVPARR